MVVFVLKSLGLGAGQVLDLVMSPDRCQDHCPGPGPALVQALGQARVTLCVSVLPGSLGSTVRFPSPHRR